MRPIYKRIKMKKHNVLYLIVLLFFLGCSKKLPPDYKFLCSIKGKKVTLQYPDDSIGPNVWNYKYQAAHFARYWEKERKKPFIKPSDSYNWEKCP